MEVQRAAKCIVGKDYPTPIVDHAKARQSNLDRFAKALEQLKSGAMPEKFGNAKEDVGPMKTTYQSALSFQPSDRTVTLAESNRETVQLPQKRRWESKSSARRVSVAA